MSKRFAAVALAPLLFLPGVSSADSSIGLRAGSLGLGVELSYAVSQRFALRLATDAYTRTFTSTQQDVEYDAKAKLKTISSDPSVRFRVAVMSCGLSPRYSHQSSLMPRAARMSAASGDVPGGSHQELECSVVLGCATCNDECGMMNAE